MTQKTFLASRLTYLLVTNRATIKTVDGVKSSGSDCPLEVKYVSDATPLRGSARVINKDQSETAAKFTKMGDYT